MLQDSMRRRTTLPKLTDRLTLGPGLRVSPFCLGTTRSPDTVLAAFDAGINFFFLTADLHWARYEPLRQGLLKLLARGRHIRKEIVVGVASYCGDPSLCAAGFQDVMESLPSLKRIDVMIVAGAYDPECSNRISHFHEFRHNALYGARCVGASFHDRTAALSAINEDLVDIALIRYNPTHSGATSVIFPFLKPSRRSLIYNFKSTWGFISPRRLTSLGLDRSYWRPKITDYYRFVLTRPEIDGLLCSTGTPGHVTELIKALEKGPLDREEEKYLNDLGKLNRRRWNR